MIEINQDYQPEKLERKQVYGITFEQGRNELDINKDMFTNIVTENKELPDSAKIDMAVAMITLKIYPVQLSLLRKERTGHWNRCRPAVQSPLHQAGRSEGRQLVPASGSSGAESEICGWNQESRQRQRH